jgi:general secretion pathway protein D
MRRALATAGLALLLAACATSSAFRAGERAERQKDYDQAVLEYSRALQQSPNDERCRESLRRARLRAANEHARVGRLLSSRNLLKEAVDEFRLAVNLNPDSATLIEEARALEERLQSGRPGPSIEAAKQEAREKPLQGLEPGPAAELPLRLYFRDSSLREAYLALGKLAGVSFVFDPDFRDQTISVDLEEVPFDQALSALDSQGKCFHQVLEPKVLNIIPDSAAKRREYEQHVVKTFYLSNADLKETIDLLRIVLGARRVAPLPGGNALTLNDTPEKVAAAERIIQVVDKRRAEVMVEVEILEVNRNLLKEYGIEITSGIEGVDGVLGAIGPNPEQTFTLEDSPYARENLVVVGLPGVVYRLLQNDSATRVLANPQLRTTEGEKAEARFGDEVPVPVTVFSPIAQGGLAQQPVTSFEYRNVGVNIDITPRVHHDGDITLELKLEISAVGATGYGNLPTFQTRQVNSVLRLREGETSVLAGLISDTERQTLRGIPGLASIPFFGKLFSDNRTESVETDIIMTLTPHVLSRPSLSADDLKSFKVGGETAPLLFEVPATAPTARPSAPGIGSRIEPVRPPQIAPTPTPVPNPEEPQ